ncbi:MAG: hypothetical protein Q8P22_01300 [Chloroflexota bacterium]|nr:hypothetical protein [Chloroflexota bacterium]
MAADLSGQLKLPAYEGLRGIGNDRLRAVETARLRQELGAIVYGQES